MNATIGWVLAALAMALGFYAYGWQGVVIAASAMVFWLLLQFSRAMRVMRVAGGAPVGLVRNAVMLQSKLRPGLRLIEVIPLTRSLGEKLSDNPETYRWRDAGGDAVEVELVGGRVHVWRLVRAGESAAVAGSADADPPARADA